MILEKCPNCGGELSICSKGGVNCPECMQFIRMLNKEEMKEHQEELNKFLKENN